MEKRNHIIDGQAIAERIKDEIADEVFSNFQEKRPSLAIILVGNRSDSELYVSLKEREAKKVGIDTHLYRLDEEDGEEKLREIISFLNKDPEVDAILIQLPLPKGWDTDGVIATLDPLKDADGFHPEHPDYVLSPVIAAVDFIVREEQVTGRAGIFYRSEVFGQSLKEHLLDLELEVDLFPVAESEDPRSDEDLKEELSSVSSKDDILISALGLPGFLTKEYCKSEAIVVDVGISKSEGKVVGDLDMKMPTKHLLAFTPVPGGIGPMTIAFLFKNVIAIAHHR